MKALCLYLHMELFVFQNFTKRTFGSNLLFPKFGSERIKVARTSIKERHKYKINLMNRCSLTSPRIPHKVVLLVALTVFAVGL